MSGSGARAVAASEAVDTASTWDLIKKRKYGVRAVGVTVVVVCCTLIGSQLKTSKQEKDKLREIERAAEELALDSAPAEKPTLLHEELQAATPALPAQKSHAGDAIARPTHGSQLSLDITKQIALLEDRKAILNRQRGNIEAKIDMLRDRRARKEEMEARRSGTGLQR